MDIRCACGFLLALLLGVGCHTSNSEPVRPATISLQRDLESAVTNAESPAAVRGAFMADAQFRAVDRLAANLSGDGAAHPYFAMMIGRVSSTLHDRDDLHWLRSFDSSAAFLIVRTSVEDLLITNFSEGDPLGGPDGELKIYVLPHGAPALDKLRTLAGLVSDLSKRKLAPHGTIWDGFSVHFYSCGSDAGKPAQSFILVNPAESESVANPPGDAESTPTFSVLAGRVVWKMIEEARECDGR